MANNLNKKEGSYNSIITLILIAVLITIRIFINNYSKQNIVIAFINFFSMFYVLWRIYYSVNKVLLSRIEKNSLFKKQHSRYKHFALIVLLILIITIGTYIIMLFTNSDFYSVGGCINDIISLCALLFSIEDENITNLLIEHYRYS